MLTRLTEFMRKRVGSTGLTIWAVLLLLQVILYTALIYYAIPALEGVTLTWPESLLFVLQTMTTVGYDLVTFFPATNQMTIWLIILIMTTGVFTVLMLIPVALAPYITSMLQTSAPTRVPLELEDHTVIVGTGELTRALVESLLISPRPIVVVESDERKAKAMMQRYHHQQVHVVWGEYGEQRTWEQVWVKNASDVIVCEDERTTATVILGIRDLGSGRIIAVVDDLSFDRYLRYAGAEYVLSPKNFTGRILSRHAVLRSDINTTCESVIHGRLKMDKCELDTSLKLINVPIMEGCTCIGNTLEELDLFRKYGVDVLFYWKGGNFILNPDEKEVVDASTMLFLLGMADSLAGVVEKEFTPEIDGEEQAVIAGFGDVGRSVYRELSELGIKCIVVDPNIEEKYVVTGRAEHEPVLKEALIDEARFCIVSVNDDNVNIFTTLLARNLNPNIRILARANDPSSVDKLYRAGADYVALLPTIGGQVIAGIVLSDIVQVLLDLPNAQKVVMKHIMKHVPTTVGWIQKKSGVRVLGIDRTEQPVVRPLPDELLREGDALVAVGDIESLKKFIDLL
jgi:voltage-gated potassium channel